MGAIAAGALLVVAMVPIDIGLAVANAAVITSVPPAELLLVPVDIAAAWLTWQGANLALQGAERSCEDVRLPLIPWE